MKVMIVGSGGREHAIAFKVAQNPNVEKIYCAPGNGGTYFEEKCVNVSANSIDEMYDFAKKEAIDLTIIGPEVYLCDGIVDKFKAGGLKVFGPSKEAAQLEGSKIFSKKFMQKYGIKTAACETFDDKDKALEYLKTCPYPAVIKADGLAAGKGVVICQDYAEAQNTINDFMVSDIFHGSGKKLVIEEFLDGVEASILSITDGQTIIPFISAKDHKNIFDEDKGPNTGGMGAIAPNPYCSQKVLDAFYKDILIPTEKGFVGEKLDYTGIVFFGLMITMNGVYLLEYNVRMGDPETQVVLQMMKSDFVDVINAALDKKLSDYKMEWYEGGACCIVAASKGYPGSYKTGYKIDIKPSDEGKVFIAGAEYKDGELYTTGGRVLCFSSRGETLQKAIDKAYVGIKSVDFEGLYHRNDIGKIYRQSVYLWF